MIDFTESNDIVTNADALRRRLADDGYLYFRTLLPAADVGALRSILASILADSRWLAAASNPDDLRAGPEAVGAGAYGFHGTYTAIQMRQEFHEFALHPILMELTEQVLGEPVFCHPMHICRISPPVTRAVSTPIHQDYRLIQGFIDTLTTWIPLADAPPGGGGLRVLRGSHKLGVLPVEPVDAPGGVAADVADDDPRWRSTSFTAGDVLLFPSLTAHGGLPNTSDRLRLSLDFRYQPLTAPISDYDGSFKPHHFPRVPDWRTLTRGWTSTASVETPTGLHLVPRLDPATPDMPAQPSRYVASAANTA